jgi:hypothetical protein
VIVNLMGCKTCFIADDVISNQYHAAHDYPLRVTQDQTVTFRLRSRLAEASACAKRFGRQVGVQAG